MHRVANSLLFARQAFCSDISSPNDDCGFLKTLECSAGLVAAAAACTEVAPEEEFECIKEVIGAASDCIECICPITGICPSML